GGAERGRRRLDGLRSEIGQWLDGHHAEDEARAAKLRRELDDLAALSAYALPLLEAIAPLRDLAASWGEWLDRLGALATRALRRPERVLSLLAELQPLAPVGPVGLAEVRLALERRLCDLTILPARRRFGRVFVAPIEAA